MSKSELTKPYAPNPLLRMMSERFFSNIQVDAGWADEVRRLAEVGTIIYVLRNLNWVDFVALDYLTKRYDLPQIRYVNDLGLWILNPLGKGWLNAILPRRNVPAEDELEDAFEHGGTAALFLKRPPTVLDVASGASGGRGLKEGDELVHALFALQRKHEKPLLLLPMVFLWSKSPDTRGTQPFDFIIGPREWPSPTRVIAQLLYNLRHVALRVGEPINIQDFLRSAEPASDDVLVRRITYATLRRLERERRTVTGPAEKSPDRVRQEILRSPKLQTIIRDLSAHDPSAIQSNSSKALDMLKELQARPDLTTIKGLEVAFDWAFHRIYRGIEYEQQDLDRVRAAARDGALILLPSHKSHIDYLILSYIFNEQNLPLPRIAAGDNLNFLPVGPIFRRGGAFFIRRSFKGDRLYAAVIDAYIRRLIRDGFPIELFLEGGRSRTGKLLVPKFGLLNMIVDAALAVPQQKVFFVPVSIGYERVIEAGEYQRELSGAEKKREEAVDLLKTPEVLRHRYGRINLQIGHILTIDDICGELGMAVELAQRPAKRRAVVTRLGNRVMDEINRVTAVTPGAVAALGLLSHPHRAIKFTQLCELCERLLVVLDSVGARVSPTLRAPGGTLRPSSIREALSMFLEAEMLDAYEAAPGEAVDSTNRGLLRRRSVAGSVRNDMIYSVVESKRLALDTSKNIIVHFFVERALVALALGLEGTARYSELHDRVQRLSRLFKYEFRFQADAPFEQILARTVDGMVDSGHLARNGELLEPGPGGDGWTGLDWLTMYRSVLQNFVEGYRIAARSLEMLLAGPMTEKELTKKALSTGNEMFLAGDIQRREAISKPILANAFLALTDLGHLRARQGKLELVDTYFSLDAVAETERNIAAFLDGRFEATA